MSSSFIQGQNHASPGTDYAERLDPLMLGYYLMEIPYYFQAMPYCDSGWFESGISGYTQHSSQGSIFVGESWGHRAYPFRNGSNNYKRITGNTRDANSNLLGSTNVYCFYTSTNTLYLSTTTPSDGYFEFGVDGINSFYLVAYKPGSPDVAGTTVNTLTGV